MTTTQRPVSSTVRPTRRKAKRRWPYVVLTAVVLAAGGWAAWRYFSPPASTTAVSPSELVAVTRGRVERAVNSSCRVISNMDVDIKCRASGEVITLPFDMSDRVKKGDLLCQLDDKDARLAVRNAEASVAQTKARLEQAKQELELAKEMLATTRRKTESNLTSAKVKVANLRAKAERQKALTAEGLASREDLETVETEAAMAQGAFNDAQIAIDELKQLAIQIELKQEAVKVAQAQLDAQEIALNTQKNQLTYTTVIAPVNGIVTALNVRKGTIVASGMSGFSGGTTIMTLSDLSRIFVIASVDESDFGGVQLEQNARVTVSSFPNLSFTGKVVRIAAKGASASNVVTFEVKVEVLDEQKTKLRPEMTGNVTILQDSRENVLTVPATAIVQQGEKSVVTMADGQTRDVVVGLQGSEMVEVVSGLSEGEKIKVLSTELPTRWKSDTRGRPPH